MLAVLHLLGHDGRQSIQVAAPVRSREFLPAGMQGVSNRTAGMLSDYALERTMSCRALLFECHGLGVFFQPLVPRRLWPVSCAVLYNSRWVLFPPTAKIDLLF